MAGISIRLAHKIVGIGIVGLIGVVLVGGIHFYGQSTTASFRSIAAAARGVAGLADKLQIDLLEARRAEKDFLLRNDAKKVQSQIAFSEAAATDLDALRNAIVASGNPELAGRIEPLGTALQAYNAHFAAVVAEKNQLGLDEKSGLEGRLRGSVHDIEALATELHNPNLIVTMLTMRRHEKDFMLRRDRKYGADMKKRAAEFAIEVDGAEIPAASKAAIKQKLSDYQRDFFAWMESALKLAGEQEAMSQSYSTVEPIISGLVKSVNEIRTQAEQSDRKASKDVELQMQIAILLIGLAVFALSFLIGRAVSRPLSAMTAAMIDLSKGNLAIELGDLHRGDEIGEMSKAVQVFKDNAIEKDRLERQQGDGERAALMRRQEEIDQLIGFFGRSMTGSFKSLSGASANMSRTSSSLESAAQVTGTQANRVLSEVEQTSVNIQTVASASEQLSASIGEIGRQASESARGSAVAMQQTEDVGAKVAELRQAANQIGSVVKLINTIAGQTNLLALNATIEAARAGEAGRGFAVVAGEVKALAEQTAKATSDIAAQVASIQAATNGTAEAIQGITGTIRGVNETAVAIATAVEQQGAATKEIARSIESVTVNANSMTRGMEEVQGAVEASRNDAGEVKRTSAALADEAAVLSAEVVDFLDSLRDLGESKQLRALEVSLAASATMGAQVVQGRVMRVSPGMVLFDGALQVPAGTLIELRIATVDRALRGRFVERVAGGCQIQLLLNHEHLNFMEGAMTRLAAA